MTAELAALERRLSVKFDLVLSRLDAIQNVGKPGLTQRQFARTIGVSPRTVARMVKGRRVRLEKGRVPNSEVAKFLS
jgi:DNA-binding transcriptional regulator YdaS (Cro superfamily)